MAEHGQGGDDQRERQRPPEASLKILQLTVVFRVQGDDRPSNDMPHLGQLPG